MAETGGKSTPRSRKEAALPPEVRGMPNIGTSNLAALQAKSVLSSQVKDLAAQVALPSSRYANLIAKMSTAGGFAQASAAQRTATANLAVQTLARNPVWLEATRSLSKSLEVHRTPALSKVLGDLQTSGALAQATERWATQHARLLADAKLQLPALRSSVFASFARPVNDELLGKFANLVKGMDVGVASSLAAREAANNATRSVTLGLAEQLRSNGIVSAPWQKLFQDVQLADGLGSIARLAATPGPLLRSQSLALGVGSYASVQRLLGDLGRGREDALLRGRSLRPAATLNSYFDSLGTRPWRRRTELAGLVGNATSGLVLGESLTADLHDDDAELLASAATTDLIEPWQEAFDDVRTALFAALERLNPYLAELLRGAWHSIGNDGPAAAASAAHCLVEVVDQTLHAMVDESLLPTWLAKTGRLGRDYFDGKTGKPTRRARLAFALQTRSKRDAGLVRALEAGLAASLGPLHSQLESGKHGRVDVGVQAVRCYAVAVEGFLINLLLGG